MSSIEREKQIASRLVRAALARGCMISVNCGKESPVKRSSNAEQIIGALASTDQDQLVLYDSEGERVGSILLIWGKGDAFISDWWLEIST
jgi:hypothetical protein